MTPAPATSAGPDASAPESPHPLSPRRHERGRRNCLFQAVLVAGGVALGLGWFAAERSPAQQFQFGLRSLRQKNAEAVQYSLLSLGDRPEYESQSGLLQGWLRLQSLRPDEPADLKEVLTDLDLAASGDDQRGLALALVGSALYEQGKMREAMTRLSQSLEDNPDEPEAHRWLGVAFYDIGNVASALPHLERLAKLEPNNGRPHRLMGIIFRDLSDFERAVTAYQESLARDPRQPDADEIRLELARCQFAQLKYDDALTTLRDGHETPAVLTLRAQCFHAKGLVDQAEQCVQQALADDRDDAEALAVEATLAEERGDHQRAAELLSRAVERKPNEYNYRYRLVQAYRRIGKQELANEQTRVMGELQSLREDLETLIGQANYDTGNAQIRYGIAALAERLGMPEMAASWRKAARMLDTAAATRTGP